MRSFPMTTGLLALALFAPGAEAEVRRCETPAGEVLFTDRQCRDVGAVQRARPAGQPAAATAARRWSCARTVPDLVFEMTGAIESGDANRLAGVYHWPGLTATAAHRIWQRLDAIASRPLVDSVPVMPTVALPAQGMVETQFATGGTDAADARPTPPPDPQLYPQTAIRHAPVALRIEQTQANAATPARTLFDLTQHFGCWWVRF